MWSIVVKSLCTMLENFYIRIPRYAMLLTNLFAFQVTINLQEQKQALIFDRLMSMPCSYCFSENEIQGLFQNFETRSILISRNTHLDNNSP